MTKASQQKALESGPLERLFNGAPAKILDFLSTFQDYDYSKQDIAKNSGVSFRHALREINRLEALGLIKKTRNVGHSHMYKYNTNNTAAKLLENFALELATEECQKIANQQDPKEETIQSIETIQT